MDDPTCGFCAPSPCGGRTTPHHSPTPILQPLNSEEPAVVKPERKEPRVQVHQTTGRKPEIPQLRRPRLAGRRPRRPQPAGSSLGKAQPATTASTLSLRTARSLPAARTTRPRPCSQGRTVGKAQRSRCEGLGPDIGLSDQGMHLEQVIESDQLDVLEELRVDRNFLDLPDGRLHPQFVPLEQLA